MADKDTARVVTVFQIELPPGNEWQRTGPEEFPEACLLAPRSCIKIGDHAVDVHIEAVAVVESLVEPEHPDGATIQSAAHDDYQACLDGMGECAFETIKIGDHDYVLHVEPFST